MGSEAKEAHALAAGSADPAADHGSGNGTESQPRGPAATHPAGATAPRMGHQGSPQRDLGEPPGTATGHPSNLCGDGPCANTWESTEFSGTEKYRDPFPRWERPGSDGKNRFPAGGDLPGGEQRKHVGSGVVPGDTQGTTGDAPVSPACNKHSRDQILNRKVAPDRNRQEPTPVQLGHSVKESTGYLRTNLHPHCITGGIYMPESRHSRDD